MMIFYYPGMEDKDNVRRFDAANYKCKKKIKSKIKKLSNFLLKYFIRR